MHSSPHHNGLSSLLNATTTIDPSLSTTTTSNDKHQLQPYNLSIQPQPPRTVFKDNYVTIRLFLIDHKSVLKTGLTVHLDAKLCDANTGKICDDHIQSILQLDPDTPLIIKDDGNVTLRVKLTELSMLHQNTVFTIQFSHVQSADDAQTSMPVFEPIQTTPFSVVRYQLKIIEQPPAYWYKDEGGRDKSIQLSCVLLDHNDQLVRGREIPLNCILMYHNDNIEKQQQVKKQDILKMQNDEKPKISADTGKCTVRIRIEEVSKNHQKQLFCVKFESNVLYDPSNADIAPDTTKPITILSKRNKRKKKDGTFSAHFTDDLENVGGSDTGVKNEGENGNRSVHQHSGNTSGVNIPTVSPLINTHSDTSPSSKQFDQVVASMNGIISYCQYACKTLLQLEWQHIGFEVTENGALNLHRPIYRCCSCWTYKDTIRTTTHQSDCNINRLINLYQNYTIQHLNDIVGFLNTNEIAMKTHRSASNESDNDSQMSDHSEHVQSHSPLHHGHTNTHHHDHHHHGVSGMAGTHSISPAPNSSGVDLTSLNRNQSLSIPFLTSFSSIPPALQQTLSYNDLALPIRQHTTSDVNLSVLHSAATASNSINGTPK